MATKQLLPSGTWRLRAYGFDTANPNKRVQFSKTWTPPQGMTAKRAEKEAERLAIEFETEVRGGVSMKGDTTLAAYFDWWRDAYAVPNLAPKTVLEYTNLWRRVNEYMGPVKVKDVDATRIQAFYGWLKSTARNAHTGEAIIRQYNQALSYAVVIDVPRGRPQGLCFAQPLPRGARDNAESD